MSRSEANGPRRRRNIKRGELTLPLGRRVPDHPKVSILIHRYTLQHYVTNSLERAIVQPLSLHHYHVHLLQYLYGKMNITTYQFPSDGICR